MAIMRYAEKLYKQMLLKGLNQQKLAKSSSVSDSEVSRILAGRSQPGLENAFRLSRAVGVSLDYLADDTLETDPIQPVGPASANERDILDVAKELGFAPAYRLLDIARVLGPELAIRRLLGAESKPVIEVGDGSQPAPEIPVAKASSSKSRASSA
jgi:transcriptional regulator with XRE-family HTH domain